MARYSKNFDRDYEFYLRHVGRFQFAGGATIPELVIDLENGVDAKRAFHAYDSNGVVLPCREAELFRDIVITKKGITFHLKMWAEGYHDLMEGIQYYMDEFDNPPDWLETAFRNQVYKRCGCDN